MAWLGLHDVYGLKGMGNGTNGGSIGRCNPLTWACTIGGSYDGLNGFYSPFLCVFFIGGDICLGQVVSGVFGCVLAVLYFLSFFLFPPTIRLLGSYIRLFDIARHRKCLFSVETNTGRRTGGSTVFILITSACDCSSLLL